jgi:hypothetical protein
MNYILVVIISLLQNATCLAYKWKSGIIGGCLFYKFFIVVIVLSLSDLDQIIFFPTNRRNKYGILLYRLTAVTLCSMYGVKLTHFSSWLHFKEKETNLRTMAYTKINLNQFSQSHPLSINCPNLITISFKLKIFSQNNGQ